MRDAQDTEPDSAPSWEALEERIHWWLVPRFGLNRPLDKDVWLLCIGAAMELERLAVGVLWIHAKRPKPFPEYQPKMTLNGAHKEIERRRLLDAVTRKTLKHVAALRNSVAHRQAIFVTATLVGQGQEIGQYKGRHVFSDRHALDELTRDMDAAARVMYDWMAVRAPDLAEAARQSGAHPTSP